MRDPGVGRHAAVGTIATTVAGLGGLMAASAALGYEAVARTDSHSAWRDLLGPLGSISIFAALAAVGLGVTAVLIGERRRSRVALAAAGAGLALLALAYWAWVIEGILDTT